MINYTNYGPLYSYIRIQGCKVLDNILLVYYDIILPSYVVVNSR